MARWFLAEPSGLRYTGDMAGEARARRLRLPLAPEAWTEVAVVTLGLLGAIVLALRSPGWLSISLLCVVAGLWLLVVFFARNPRRRPEPLEGAYFSPADGKVLTVEQVREPHFILGEAWRVAIFMSFFDVHVNRSPTAGTVEFVKHTPGEYLQAFRPEAAERNESNLIGMQLGAERVLIKQVAGILARRIVCSVRPGQRLRAGERLGMIKLGSRVELFLRPQARPLVQVGDRVRAGVTPLAQGAQALQRARDSESAGEGHPAG